jgi:hypothetical protein
MKKYAADNLMFLREQYAEIYKLIRNRSYNREGYIVHAAKNGEAIVSIKTGDNRNRAVYSRYNPTLEAERWAQSVAEQVEKKKDIVIYGFGFGYHLEAFLKAYPDKRVFVYEPQLDMFLCAVEHRDLRPILNHKKIAMFAVGEDSIVQMEMLTRVFAKSDERIALLEIPVYKQLFPDTLQRYRQVIKEAAKSSVFSLRTLTGHRKEWIRNKILNMAVNIRTPSLKGLKGSCSGIPAIIVGSGPSLGMEAETLRRLKGRAFIIAAGTSIQALLKHRIEPDLVVVMDPTEDNFKAFEHLELENIPILYIPTVHSSILLKKYRYLMHAFFNLDTPTAYFMQITPEEDPVFQSTGTVSGTAIQTALYLGCSEIVLIGQDFSFPGERYYTDGVAHRTEEVLSKQMHQSEEWIENVQGSQNRTNRTMNVLREGIEQLINLYPERNYYNASRVGAVIKGTKLKTLDELDEELADNYLGTDWFTSKIEHLLTPYDETRRSQIRGRMSEFYYKSVQFAERFEKLEKHIDEARVNLDHYNDRQITSWFKEFELQWMPIIDDEAFRHVHGFFLQREMNYMDRHWPQLLEEKNLRTKLTILLELMKPVMSARSEVNSLIIARLDELANTAEFSDLKKLN